MDPIDKVCSMPGGPPKKKLIGWKGAYPEVLCLFLRDDEIYIYRYLNFIEWRQQILTQPKLIENTEVLKDAIVARCVLWPEFTPESMNAKQAGLRDLLYEVIMQSSYFIDPQQAMGLVAKL
jgi:hypothetical protein